ncbi:MAG: PAS domain-containing sensor histidine kinase [Rhizobiaceae bacterium]
MHDITAPWVNASVPSGCEEFRQHAGFIQYNAVAGMIGLSLIPAALALKDQVTDVDALVFALLASPLALAAFVSRSGQLERGKQAALLCFALFVALLIGTTGGLYSPMALLLCVLPVETMLWRCKTPLRLALGLILVSLSVAAVAASIFPLTAASTGLMAGLEKAPWLALGAVAYALTIAWRMQDRLSQSASRLARESRHLDLFTRHSNELITRHAADGSTLFASPAARHVLGVAGKDLLESGLLNRVHIQDRVVLLKALSDAVQQGKEQVQRIRIRSGERGERGERYESGGETRLWKLIEIRCHADSVGHSGGATEAVCSMRDVSELQELNDDLQASRVAADELNHAQRHFLATMSHELRTPLNAIVGFSDILQQELFGRLPHEKHREYVTLIQDSGQHLLNVVNDMLDMSRIEAGKYELSPCNFAMSEVAQATIAMLQPMAAKGGVKVTFQLDQSLPDINADKRACQQILINLLSNAIKFTPEGGDVKLSVKQFGRALRIRLKDNGIGIDEDFLSNIGQPFSQADSGHQRQFEGSGIGLSVVKGLVALHNGEFLIKSKTGAGTEVTITLPLKISASRPVPTDNSSQLVHLKSVASNQVSTPRDEVPVRSKGERRARVSA